MVTGRPLRGFLAARPSFFLAASSLLRATRLASRIFRSSTIFSSLPSLPKVIVTLM